MVKTYSKVHIFAENEIIQKSIYSAVSAEEITVTFSNKKDQRKIDKILSKCEVVFAEFPFLKYLKNNREKVIVIKPDKYTRRLLGAGYRKFLFDPLNHEEIYRVCVPVQCTCKRDLDAEVNSRVEKAVERRIEDTADNKVVKVGKLVMDFTAQKVWLDDKELYLTKSEYRYLRVRFLLKDKKRTTKLRINLHRMRQKFGKEFLDGCKM